MVALGGVRLGSQARSSGAAGRDGCEDSQLPMVATPARRSPRPRNPNPSLPGRAVALRSGGAGGAEARHLELPERPPGVSGLTDGTRGPGSQGRWGGRCPPSSSPSRGRRTKPGPAHAWRPRAPLQLAEPLRGSQPPPSRAGTRGVRPAGHLTAPRRGLRERVGRTATAGGGGGGAFGYPWTRRRARPWGFQGNAENRARGPSTGLLPNSRRLLQTRGTAIPRIAPPSGPCAWTTPDHLPPDGFI